MSTKPYDLINNSSIRTTCKENTKNGNINITRSRGFSNK